MIDELIGQLDKSALSGPLGSVTGVGGMIRRGVETAANVTGISNDTSAHDFETKLSDLQLMVAPILAGSSRTAKDQREKIEKVIRGLKPGDTRQSTRSALLELKKQLSGLPADEDGGFEMGKVYKDANGNRATYMGDGKWQAAQ